MAEYARENGGNKKIALLTESSMADNLRVAFPKCAPNLIRPRDFRCKHMRAITLCNLLDSLLADAHQVDVPEVTIKKAEVAVRRMIEIIETDMEEKIETEVLVIGSGIAGATAALKLADAGINVVLVTRANDFCESNSYHAQGGIIYKGLGEKDSSELQNDILEAGAGISNPRAVEIISAEGPRLVDDFLIDRIGVDFNRDNGELSRTKEGGHSIKRIIHRADETGKAIEAALAKTIERHPNIRVLTNVSAVDLLTPGHHSSDKMAIYELVFWRWRVSSGPKDRGNRPLSGRANHFGHRRPGPDL